MKFVLFQKLAGLQGGGLVMFLLSVIAVAALLIGIIRYKKTSHPAPKTAPALWYTGRSAWRCPSCSAT